MKPLSRPHITNMFDMYVTFDDKSKSFGTTRKRNHSANVPIMYKNMFDQGLLETDTLQCQQYITMHMACHKISPSGKEYLCFHTDRRTAWFV